MVATLIGLSLCWQEIATLYYERRLRREQEYLLEVVAAPTGTVEGTALSRFLATAEGEAKLVAEFSRSIDRTNTVLRQVPGLRDIKKGVVSVSAPRVRLPFFFWYDIELENGEQLRFTDHPVVDPRMERVFALLGAICFQKEYFLKEYPRLRFCVLPSEQGWKAYGHAKSTPCRSETDDRLYVVLLSRKE